MGYETIFWNDSSNDVRVVEAWKLDHFEAEDGLAHHQSEVVVLCRRLCLAKRSRKTNSPILVEQILMIV